MTFRTLALAASAMALAAPATGAFAQVATQAPAAPAGPTAPVIPGLCVFSRDLAIRASTVGKYVGQRLAQIDNQSNAELTAQKAGLDAEARTLEAQRNTLGEQAFATQATAFNQKLEGFQRLVQQRVQESQLTEEQAIEKIGQEMSPLALQVIQQKGCSLVIERGTIVFFSQGMDITSDVVTLLDSKITQFPFERATLPVQGQAGPAAAAPAAGPARPAATPAARPPAAPARAPAGPARPPAR